jgi:hypothetical protein
VPAWSARHSNLRWATVGNEALNTRSVVDAGLYDSTPNKRMLAWPLAAGCDGVCLAVGLTDLLLAPRVKKLIR